MSQTLYNVMKYQAILIVVLFTSLLLVTPVSRVQAQDDSETQSQDELVDVDFSKGVSLKDFIQFVSQYTKTRFLYSDSVVEKQNVTVVAQQKIPKSSLFSLLLSVLRSKGLTAVKEGLGQDDQEIWKIKRVAESGTSSSVVKQEKLPESDRLVSKVFRLKHVNAVQARKEISKLATKRAKGVLAIKSVNALIVTDYASKIEQISNIINLMDEPVQEPAIRVIELHHVAVSRAQQTLEELTPGLIQEKPGSDKKDKGAPELPKILAHPSRKSLILMALPEHMKQLVKMVQKLDTEVREPPTNVHTYRLNNTQATQIAEKVQTMFNTSRQQQKGQKETGSTQPKQVNIQPIESQNALMVGASERTWKNQIRPMLEDLDRKRPQVLISATIAEVSGSINKDIGVDLAARPQGSDDSLGLSTTGIVGETLVDTNGDDVPDAFVPGGRQSAGTVLGLFQQDRQEVLVMGRLFQEDQIINISQLPYIVANDNTEANLSVKDEIPFQETTALEGGQTQQNVQFEEAGLELNITPHITEEDYLRLDVNANFNQFKGQSSQNLPPQKTVRELATGLTVPDHRTVVMGGLTSRVKDTTESGIPFLKDIPVLGYLFRRNETSNKKTTLYIFLTPHILRDKRFRDYRGLSREKKQGARKLTGLDFGTSDSLVGPTGALDTFQMSSPYSDTTRNRTLRKFGNLFETSQDLSPRIND